MKKVTEWFRGVPKNIAAWFIASVVLEILGFLFFDRSWASDMVVFIWIIAAVTVLYISRRKDLRTLTAGQRYIYAGIGVLVSLSSFANYFAPGFVFWNPPYSLGEFTVMLSGLSMTFFALLGHRPLLLPAFFPSLVLFGAQLYDTYQSAIEVVAKPLLGPTTALATGVINLIGIKADWMIRYDPLLQYDRYVIEILSQDGVLRGIEIVTDCTGVWSLSAFTASLLIVSLAFRKVFSRKSLPYLAVGYIGTYIANIVRILVVGISVYLYGYGSMTTAVHLHAGWVAFSGWMILFWYLFFSRSLLAKDETKLSGGKLGQNKE